MSRYEDPLVHHYFEFKRFQPIKDYKQVLKMYVEYNKLSKSGIFNVYLTSRSIGPHA